MNQLSNKELSEISNHLGEFKLKNVQKVSGGCIHDCWKIEFLDSSFFVKKNKRINRYLKFEKYCLEDLEKYINYQHLIIPKPKSYFVNDGTEFLIMDWIEMNQNDQSKLGRGLAEMHIKSNKSSIIDYGYPIKGYIGTTTQIECWEKNWADCFINYRIKIQLNKLKNKTLNNKVIDKLISKIRLVLNDHKPFISLIHGDLWSGNISTGGMGKGVIFDPACWWADCEVDIAMSRLFGGFNREFYEEYYKIKPKNKDFQKRTIIYNLYHVLNHANMFGGGYLNQVDNYIENILRM